MEEKIKSQIVKALMDNDIDVADKLLAVHAPKSLFKYRAGTQRDIDALKANKVWIGRASFLDDDEDARFRVKNVDAVCSVIDIMATKDEKFKNPKYKRDVSNIAETSKKDSLVCSFSETAENEYMWKNYANEYNGFCIEYEFAKLQDSNNLLLVPVSYSLKKPMDIWECTSKQYMVFMQLFTKYPKGINGEPWNEQMEWRYACFANTLGVLDDEKGKLISAPILKKIIFGKNMPDKNKTQIIDWIDTQKYNIDIQQS